MDGECFYKDLTKHVRHLIAGQIDGRYQYLKNPNNRSKGVDSVRIRPKVLFRPINFPQSGQRNLTVGGSELILIMQGAKVVRGDWQSGIEFDEIDYPYRFALGLRVRNNDFGITLMEEFRGYFNIAKRFLKAGRYDLFTKNYLKILDDNLAIFNCVLTDGFYD